MLRAGIHDGARLDRNKAPGASIQVSAGTSNLKAPKNMESISGCHA